MEDKIKAYVLANAVKHEGKANEKAIIGKLMATYPELRENISDVQSKVEELVTEVNS